MRYINLHFTYLLIYMAGHLPTDYFGLCLTHEGCSRDGLKMHFPNVSVSANCENVSVSVSSHTVSQMSLSRTSTSRLHPYHPLTLTTSQRV